MSTRIVPPTPEQLLSRARTIGSFNYSALAEEKGIRLATGGLLEHIRLSKAQALHFVCYVLMSRSEALIKQSFSVFPHHRREVADALLIAESYLYKAGEDFVVNSVDEARGMTDVQLFGLLCESVNSFEEFLAVMTEQSSQKTGTPKEEVA